MIFPSSQGLRGMPRARPPAVQSHSLDLVPLPTQVKQEGCIDIGSSQDLGGMSRARPPAVQSHSLDLVSLPIQVESAGYIDIGPIVDVPSAMNMDDEDRYIQEIPGLIGIKRSCPDVTHSGPSKLQATAPRPTNKDLLKLIKNLDSSTADKPVTCPLNMKGDKWAKDGGKMKREKKMRDLAEVTHRKTLLRLYEGLREDLLSQKLQCTNHINSFKEYIIENEGRIKRRETEISDLKHSMLELNTEKQALIKRHDREIEDLIDYILKLNREKEGQRSEVAHRETLSRLYEGPREDLFRLDQSEKQALIMSHEREIEHIKDYILEQAWVMRHDRDFEDHFCI